ncbi:PBS lyase HEAT domain protein repeat-containing protein, partial [Reticulomyxa filosa]
TISTKLNDKQLDRVFSAFIYELKSTNQWVRESCSKSLGIIATKASEKQLEEVINALMSGLKDEDKYVRVSCAKSLGIISEKLNEKQLDNAINTLIDGFKDKDENVRESCAKSLGVISANLADKQLEGVFNALPKGQIWAYFDSYEKALKEISTEWNEKQSNALIFVFKHSINTNNYKDKNYLLMRLLELISTKLNDKQLYLLV